MTDDARSFECGTCGARPGQPCITIQERVPSESKTYGYRGRGRIAEHVHQSRLVQLVSARRGVTDCERHQT